MELLSFAFGVLAAVGLAFVIVIVVGIVKVMKMNGKIAELYQSISELNQIMEENKTASINGVDNAVNYTITEIDSIKREFEKSYSYIDSRIDKALSK